MINVSLVKFFVLSMLDIFQFHFLMIKLSAGFFNNQTEFKLIILEKCFFSRRRILWWKGEKTKRYLYLLNLWVLLFSITIT